VRFIDDQQIPALPAVFAGLGDAPELLEHVGLLEIMVTRDDSLVCAPGIGVHAELALEFEGARPIDHLEGQGELLVHLFAPLHAERRGAENEHPPDTPSQHQLAEHHARLDGLSQADGVRQHERHAGHLQSTEHRNELVSLRINRAVKRRCRRRAVFVQAGEGQRGGERGPTGRSDHGVELPYLHRRGVFHPGKRGGLEDLGPGFDFPQHLVGFGPGALAVLDLDEVEASSLVGVEGLNAHDHRAAVANDRHHAFAWIDPRHASPPLSDASSRVPAGIRHESSAARLKDPEAAFLEDGSHANPRPPPPWSRRSERLLQGRVRRTRVDPPRGTAGTPASGRDQAADAESLSPSFPIVNSR